MCLLLEPQFYHTKKFYYLLFILEYLDIVVDAKIYTKLDFCIEYKLILVEVRNAVNTT